MSISLGAIGAALVVVWTSVPAVPESFHDWLYPNYAKIEDVELLAGDLSKTNQTLTLVVVQAQLREARKQLAEIERMENPSEYWLDLKSKLEADIKVLEAQERCLKDSSLC